VSTMHRQLELPRPYYWCVRAMAAYPLKWEKCPFCQTPADELLHPIIGPRRVLQGESLPWPQSDLLGS
jgi:hypothetical protein